MALSKFRAIAKIVIASLGDEGANGKAETSTRTLIRRTSVQQSSGNTRNFEERLTQM